MVLFLHTTTVPEATGEKMAPKPETNMGGDCPGHRPPPSEHLGLFWREKNIKHFFPATTEQNITRVNFLRKPSE